MENKTKKSGYTKPKISDLRIYIASLEKQLAEAKAHVAQQKGINDSLSKTIEELSDEVKEKEEIIHGLNDDMARLERLKSDKESHIEYLRRLNNEYMAETDRLESYVESIYKRNLLQRIFNKRVARAITATSIKKSSE